MSILILPPSTGEARIRYIPVAPQIAFLYSQSALRRITVAFSPWFIGQNTITAPVIIGGSGLHIPIGRCPYNLNIETPEIQHIRGILSSQERPKVQ